MIVTLAGGVGAARMLAGLVQVVDPADLTAVVNVGDDLVLHGLHISPDLDTVTYTLAGAINTETGWGLTGETWQARAMLERYGGVSWFGLGDRDLGTHLYRTQRLAEGADLATVTAEIAAAWDLGLQLLPVTDDPLRTMVTLAADDEAGPDSPGLPAGTEIGFQEYFVQRHHSVPVSSVRFAGAEAARPTPGVLDVPRHRRGDRGRPVQPDRVDRPGAGRARRARGRRRPARPRRRRVARSSPAPPSRAPPTACSSSSATRPASSASPASTPPSPAPS